MIRSFKISNFGSINTSQEVSFVVSDKEMLDESSFKSTAEEGGINAVNCFVGHNATGKTKILQALTFLLWFAQDSYHGLQADKDIPFEQHLLNKTKVSDFELIFENNKKLYRYILKLSPSSVLHEELGVHVSRDFSYIYKMNRSNDEFEIKEGKDLPSINDGDKKRFIERKNCSLFSFLLNTKYLSPLNFNSTVFSCVSNVDQLGWKHRNRIGDFLVLGKQIFSDPLLKDKLTAKAKEYDFGIFDLSAEKQISPPVETKSKSGEERYITYSHHKNQSGDNMFKLPLLEESAGTQNALYLLAELYPILSKGGIAIYDEIESSLHPLVVKKIVSLFESKETNQNNAQLIFSTHQHVLLNDRTKTQIFLTEKNENLETEVYRLDSVEGVRNGENFFNKYMSGVYGGLPDFRWL